MSGLHSSRQHVSRIVKKNIKYETKVSCLIIKIVTACNEGLVNCKFCSKRKIQHNRRSLLE